MPPQVISNRYELVQPLSHGGMGDIWRGYDRTLDRPVAVKLVRQAAIGNSPEVAEEFAKRFRREARITARIQHPGVPQVFDALLGDDFDNLYLIMELVDGLPLYDYIDPNNPLPIAWAAAIAAQVCTVLSHAHEVPVIHRDLKPGNIIVARDGTVKVLDFGIAAILRTDVTKLTATGSPVGTSQYMSPEQVQASRITPQSDLYALGCVLHELLCGKTLFDGNAFLLMRQHVEAPPRPLRDLRPEVPEPLEALVLHLLRKRPERRPADTQEVYERLLPFLPQAGEAPAPAGTGLDNIPDPTRLYRQPYAPRPRPTRATAAAAPTVLNPQALPPVVPVPAQLAEDIRAARAHAEALLEEERFAQAAEVLGEVLEPAVSALGVDNRKVLDLRQMRAAVLFLGGDFRNALPEFDALAEAYARTSGPAGPNARLCRAQAAHCRAELGQVTAALEQFEAVLVQVSASEGDAGEEAIELRRAIGFLLLSEGRYAEARDVLEALHQDLCLVNGPDDDETAEIADALTRIRLAHDSRNPRAPRG